MSIDMNKNYVKLLMAFRREDLPAFAEEHERLYKEAKKTGDHLAVTSHYYSVMSNVINDFFGGNFHFAPPPDKKATLETALTHLHRIIGEKLHLSSEKNCVDLGCGIGGVIRDLALTGATFTGITIASNEAEMGNADFLARGIDSHCRLLAADCHSMPLEEKSQDAAYAIYSLKYFPKLDGVMKETSRILRERGRFVVYDLIKTDEYDQEDPKQREIVEGLEFACGMPSLHTRKEMIESASAHGLRLIEEEDLSRTFDAPYHFCFSHSPLFMWLCRSPFVETLMKFGEAVRILPRGFRKFNEVFLAGTVDKIVRGGEMGLLSGSKILVFEKIRAG